MLKVNFEHMGYLIRFGFIIRGILYILTGFYGLEVAAGLQRNIKTTTDIIKTLSSIPFGNILLIAIFIGCIGYGIWGFIRASRPGNIITRVGYLASGLSYLAICLLPFGFSAKPDKLPYLVGIIAIIGGLSQIIYGYEENFKATLKIPASKKQLKILEVTGKYGYMAHGMIFILLGISLVLGKAPGGPILLGLTSGGLIALGVYSIIASRVVKLKTYD